MRKNIVLKGLLLLTVMSVLAIAFTGCGAVVPIVTTGTVYIYVTGGWFYDLAMDNVVKFWGVAPGTYVLYNVPIGNHYFDATDTWGPGWGYDGYTQYITAGNNYIYLYP